MLRPAWYRSLLIALALSLAMAQAAQAGWRYAEWGMSKAEVIAASGDKARPYVVANRRSWGEYPDLAAPFADMTHTFEVWFYFDRYKERLYAIRLVPTGSYWCIDIRRKVMDRYGSTHRFIDEIAVWEDKSANNRISITGFRGCTVKYEPLRRE